MTFKKILSGSLAAAMLAGTLAAGGATFAEEDSAQAEKLPFNDLVRGSWYDKYVSFAYENELMIGTAPSKFEPDAPLTRAMFVTILGRAYGAEENESGSGKFKDVEKGSWYSGYVGWAAENGIVNGTSPDTFEPEAPIKRAEAAAMISRYMRYAGYAEAEADDVPAAFADEDEIKENYSYADDAIDIMRACGIMDGKPSAGETPNYEPGSTSTRAEAAKLIMKLYGMQAPEEWEGYIPNPIRDGYAVYGAKYLYWGGTVMQGKLGTRLTTATNSSDYPVLSAYVIENAKNPLNMLDPDGSVGISVRVAKIDLEKTPVIKICFAYKDGSDDKMNGVLLMNSDKSSVHLAENFEFTEGKSEDGGYRTAAIDLSEMVKAHPELLGQLNFPHILLKPDVSHGELAIRYIAVFESTEAANEFSPEANAGIEDYLKNYTCSTDINYKRYSSDVEEEMNALLDKRIDEIKNSESGVTPQDIIDAGGTPYYVSSINGDDNNDGKSPETAWKTLAKLENESDVFGRVSYGDGVFFERGSVFYSGKYEGIVSMTTLIAHSYVTYSAYGKGAKPEFRNSLYFENGTGSWLPTEYPNIWVLDKIDDDPAMCGKASEIGNMAFDGGRALGIRIKSSDEDDPFGEDRTAGVFLTIGYGNNYATVSNGEEIYTAEPRRCRNIGDALQRNYEYFHDFKEGKLYLYSDVDPSVKFNEIAASRNGYVILAEGDSEDIIFDNLSLKYSGTYGLQGGAAKNMTVQNCEAGYLYGCEVETCFEFFGDAKKITIKNTYIHHGGGAMTCQNTDYTPYNSQIENIEYANNVIVSCVTGNENWNHTAPDENGVGTNKMKNQHIHDNIFAYMGYSSTKITPPSADGSVVCSSVYIEGENCVFENNTVICGAGTMFYAPISTNEHSRAWITKNNTYVFNPSHQVLQFSHETINELNQNMSKGNRIETPMNYRYLVYYNSMGFDPGASYYWYDDIKEERIVSSWLLKQK